MEKGILNKVFILLFLLSAGCASRKQVSSPSAGSAMERTNATRVEKLNAIDAAQLDFNSLSLKAKADLVINNTNTSDLTFNVRIKKDQVIWISVTAIAGLEVARALITPDSIKVLNRIESTYIHKPFNYIHAFVNDQVDFQMLQSILVGNVAPQFIVNSSEVTMMPQLQLTGKLESLSYALSFSEKNKPLQLYLKDTIAGQSMQVSYGDLILTEGKEFPQNVRINSRGNNKQLSAELRYTRIDVNTPFDVPFNVPGRFTIKN